MTPLGFMEFQRLNRKYDGPLSNFACFGFNCKLRRYTSDAITAAEVKFFCKHAGNLRVQRWRTLEQVGCCRCCLTLALHC